METAPKPIYTRLLRSVLRKRFNMAQTPPAAPTTGAMPKQRRLWYVVIAVAVAAILAFSAMAAFFYTQAADYRDSKYRTQFEILNEMTTFIPLVNDTAEIMLDTDEDNGERRAAALSGARMMELLAGDAFALGVMYDNGSDRNTAFLALGSAFSSFAALLHECYLVLSSPATFEAEYTTTVNGATGIMTQMLGYLQMGFVAGVNGIEDPYHVVGGIPMDSIATSAAALAALLS